MRKSALSVSFDDLYPENEAKYGYKWLAFAAKTFTMDRGY